MMTVVPRAGNIRRCIVYLSFVSMARNSPSLFRQDTRLPRRREWVLTLPGISRRQRTRGVAGRVGAVPMQISVPCRSRRARREIDIPALHIRADQLHAEPVADVQAFKTAHQPSFNGRMQQTHPCSLRGGAGHDASNCSPILDSSSIAAADFVTCRSTFFAASSASVQCLASAANSSFS